MATDYNIPILQKTMGVIDLISLRREGLTYAEILEHQQLPKTTLFRILQTLERNHWISKKQDRYTIGYMMIHYGLTGLSERNVRLVAKPFLEELRSLTTETSHLAIMTGKNSMIVEVCDSQKHIKPSSPIGSLLDLHCTAHGKVFLSYKITEDLEIFLKDQKLTKRTPQTITEIPALKEETRKILKNGYSVDDREYNDNIRCLAAPIWGKDNEVVAALGITATTTDFPSGMIARNAEHVLSIAKKISREMGSI